MAQTTVQGDMPESDHDVVLRTGRWKETIQGYLAAIAFMDGQIGRLLDALDKSPIRDNTIIVFWGDHGWHLGEKQHWRKFALWEEATRVPFIWVVPGVTKPGTVCERTVDFMSIYPTLWSWAAFPTRARRRREHPSAARRIRRRRGTAPAITTYLFNNHAVRTESWRYIRYADGGEELYDQERTPTSGRTWRGIPSSPRSKRSSRSTCRR